MKVTPSLPKGTRDFGPSELRKRNYIFGIIKKVFEKYGFQPLETPVMENLTTLEGKYGEEGDKLLFRILNSGDFLKEVRSQNTEISEENLKRITSMIAEKGLRYDLTIPFARYVVQHQHEITFPFKRYQIQPVWRADRPQKGRYREFYQCDADVIGSDSLICEAELLLITAEVFSKLGLNEFGIKVNHRKILEGAAEYLKVANRFSEFVTVLDKLDKIGSDKVIEEYRQRGFNQDQVDLITKWILKKIPSEENEKMKKGAEDLTKVLNIVKLNHPNLDTSNVLDTNLGRGLDYYTGSIFEVKDQSSVKIGSIAAGGRYDNLTGVFGLPGVSGVGISFGVERIYDVMEELKLFDNINLSANTTRALFINFGGDAETKSFQYLQQLRANDILAEIYPSAEKMKKQIGYADKKGIPYAIFVGEGELKNETLQVKNLKSGEQKAYKLEEVIELLRK